MPIASWQLSLRRPAHCPFIWGAGVQSPSDPHGAALAGLSRAPRSGADAPRTRPACRSAGPRRWDYCSVHRTGRPPSGPFSGGLVRAGGASRFPHVEYAAPPTPQNPSRALCLLRGSGDGQWPQHVFIHCGTSRVASARAFPRTSPLGCARQALPEWPPSPPCPVCGRCAV